jgi:hypothetical protein
VAFVQATELRGQSNNPVSGSVSSTAGNALFALIISAVDTNALQTATVSGGGTWTTDKRLESNTPGYNCQISFASCPSATGGAQTITVSVANTTTGGTTAFILEFSNMAAASMADVFDTALHASGTGTTTITTNALTNTNANDVFLAAFGTASSVTETFGSTGSGWTMPSGGFEGDAAWITGACGYKLVSATGSQTQTWSNSQSDPYASMIGCYKQGAAPPQDTPELRRGAARDNLMQQLLAQ